ncbi:MAG: hypothetical protein D3917_10850 [Candidatus Electrothrix sp. AX5]|nr:hypothetical protein [Candidatus Electrothrix sp. AX5]
MNKIVKHIDPILLGGVIGSLIISAWLWFLKITSPEISTIIALLGIIITLQIDLGGRIEKNRVKGIDRDALLNDIESLPWLETMMFDIVKSCKNIFNSPSRQYFYSQTKQQLELCKNHVQEIERGYLKTDYNDVLPLINAIASTKSILRTISVATLDVEFWNSAPGKKLWEANKSAIKRKVVIERIFVIPALSEEIDLIIKKHHNAGVTCYIINEENLNPSAIMDLIIFDDAMSYEAILNAKGYPVENLLSTENIGIKNKIENFSRIKYQATEYEGARDS